MKTSRSKPLLAGSILPFLIACSHTAAPAPKPVPTPAPQPMAAMPKPPPIFNVGNLSDTIGACTDFNGYVNAKWIASNPIPPDRSAWGAFDKLDDDSLKTQREIVEAAAKDAAHAQAGSIQQKIGWLYQTGMDEAAIEKAGFDPIKPKLAEIAALKNGAAVADYLMKSFAEGAGQVFEFGSGADFKDAKLQIAFAIQGGLGLPTPDYYSDAKYAEIRKAYLAYVAKAFTLTGSSEAEAARQADQVLALETALAKQSLSPTELRDLDNEYHFVTVKEADKVTPHFKWERFFAAQGLKVEKGFSLSQPKFFAELDKQLAHAPIAQWRAYLRFHTIDGAAPALTNALQQAQFDFYGRTLSGKVEMRPRWKRVLGLVNDSMGEALGQLYVAKTFPPEAKQRAIELVENVRLALKARIESLDWMSPATKQKALEKWTKFLPKIGYPDKWRDWSGLAIEDSSFYANVKAAQKFNYQYDLSKIGKPTDRTLWDMTPQTVNAYYDDSTNTINFPAAILQPPFFYARGDDAINYGAIGAVIGHESSHGFDDQGAQFDGDGNRENWWTPQDKAQFDARGAGLVSQFAAYTPLKDKPDLHVNGKLTLGENIADLGGLNVAYTALQMALKKNPAEASSKIDGFTQDQRFFLSWGRIWRANIREKAAELYLNVDAHAPRALRAIAAPSNMPAFAAAFGCKPGDAMVRSGDKQVKIW